MYKAVFHVHSTWSYDGVYSLEQLRTIFLRQDVQVVFMSEHDKFFTENKWKKYKQLCADISDEKLLFVPGIEYSCPHNIVHIMVWGNVPFLGQDLPTAELIDKLQKFEYFAVWAHPELKNAYQTIDHSLLKYINGVEIWNRKADGIKPSLIADRLRNEFDLAMFVGLDFHNNRQCFPLKNYVQTKQSPKNIPVFLKSVSIRPYFLFFPYPCFIRRPFYTLLQALDSLRVFVLRTFRWIFQS